MTGYPWSTGDQLFAADLNAAIALSAPPPGSAYLPTNGAVPMTGPLMLAGNATLPLHAVPLQQVPAASNALPLTGGTVTGPLNVNANVWVQGANMLSVGDFGTNSGIRLNPVAGVGNPSLQVIGPSGGTAGLIIYTQNGGNVYSNAPFNVVGTISGYNNNPTTWSGSSQMPAGIVPMVINTVFTGTSTSTNPLQFHSFTVGDGIVGQPNLAHNNLVSVINATAGMVGNPQALAVQVVQQATTGNHAAGGAYNGVCAFFGNLASFNEGGTNPLTAYSGWVFGINPDITLASGATCFAELCGGEINLTAQAGSSVFAKWGLAFVKKTGDAVQGAAGLDAAICLGDQSGVTAFWNYGILIGTEGGYPCLTGGTVIGSRPTASGRQSFAWNIDFISNTLTQGSFRSPGFTVDPTGITYIGSGAIKPDAAGMVIDTGVHIPVSATVNAGGSGYVAGLHADVAGNLWQLTVSGGVVTGATLVQATHMPSAPATIALAGAAFYGAATGGVLNVTYSALNKLTIQPSGGATAFGGSVAIPTVSGYVTVANPVPGGAAANPGAGSMLGGYVSVIGSGSILFNAFTDGVGDYMHYASGGAAGILHSNGVLTFVTTSAATAGGAAGSLMGWTSTMALDASGNLTVVGSTTLNGANFGSVIASSTTDLSHHIALYSNNYGISVTSGDINIVTGGVTVAQFGGGGITFVTPVTVSNTSTFNAGISCGSVTASSTTDLSKHISLFGSNQYGFDVTSFRLNYVVPANSAHVFTISGVDTATINTSGLVVAGSIAAATPSSHTATTYTVAAGDSALLLAPTAAMTLTLPAPATYPGRMLWLKLTTAFAVTSASANVVPIAGGSATTAIMSATAGKYCLLVSDGTNWQLMQAN